MNKEKIIMDRWSRQGLIPSDRLCRLLWEKKQGLLTKPEPWWKRIFNRRDCETNA